MYRCITEDHQNVDRQERELTRQRRETIHASFGVAVFHFEMAPLDVTEVAHPQQKLAAQVDCYRVRWPRRIEIAEPHDFRLLRPRRERPCCRAAAQRDELAAFHSITSSAMASSPGGKLRPNALEVLRLITNSNLLDCRTGRSAGFSPLRIRPVYTPAWRYASVMLAP